MFSYTASTDQAKTDEQTQSSGWAYTEVFNKVDSLHCLQLHRRTNSMKELFTSFYTE